MIYFREIELFELEFAINKRILFHKRKLYRSRKELQTDLDTWIEHYILPNDPGKKNLLR